jgi:hypothetical protein
MKTDRETVHNAPKKHDTCARARENRPKESEKALEARLRKEVEKRGGMAIKLSSQMHRGLPDRMVLLPHAVQYFVELKTTGKKPTHLQTHCHEQLRALHFPVLVIDSTKALEDFLVIADFEQAEIESSTGEK